MCMVNAHGSRLKDDEVPIKGLPASHRGMPMMWLICTGKCTPHGYAVHGVPWPKGANVWGSKEHMWENTRDIHN